MARTSTSVMRITSSQNIFTWRFQINNNLGERQLLGNISGNLESINGLFLQLTGQAHQQVHIHGNLKQSVHEQQIRNTGVGSSQQSAFCPPLVIPGISNSVPLQQRLAFKTSDKREQFA